MKTGLPAVLALLSFSQFLSAQRDPVLKQIDVPHRYYYREMYLPQLTTGPSAPAWTPDSQALLYSMAGSLWRQNLDSTVAEQLTAGAGYDYQPDCSPDGRWVVYASYLQDAIELWALDLQSHHTVQLTTGGAVNVDPRFSPDGKHIAFVSTSFHGHFHIFRGEFSGGELKNVERLTGESRSSLPRFYYSQIDHEISPAWSPDGSELLFVSNRGRIYGTGGFWRMKAEPGAQPREIHYEETTWKARPDFSPDGKRLVYASYLGGQWHQLWVMPSEGGYAFPLSYGDFDNTNPRWSPDGRRIALTSNRTGNSSLWIQVVQSGAQTELVVERRRYLKRMGELTIRVVDPAGHPTPARISLTGEDDRAYAPDGARLYAEDNFVRSERPFESHYLHSPGEATVTVPPGRVAIEVTKGLEYRVDKRSVEVVAGQHASLTIALDPIGIPPGDGSSRWLSADLHVHMNYGGVYRNRPANLVAAMAAENLPIAQDLIVNKEQRIPDIGNFRTSPDPASTPGNILLFGQEFHTSYWGHLGLLHLARHLLLPGYATYPSTAAASMFPTNANVADMAHAQQALVGYVHPFDWPPDPYTDPTLTHGEPADIALELPVDVALDKVDYIEAVGFSDHKSTAEIWYRLLNCGFRLPAGAGSDTMANFASLHGPVGLNRVYAAVPLGPLDLNLWLGSLKQGHTFATNGPLLGFTLGGRQLGDELQLPTGGNKVKFTGWLRSLVPVDHLQVICNGEVARDFPLGGQHETATLHDTISISRSGWCLLRAYSDKSEHPVLDIYPYATTSPIYIAVEGSKPHASEDARFFLTWIDRLTTAVQANQDWNTQAEKQQVLDQLSQARKIYADLQ